MVTLTWLGTMGTNMVIFLQRKHWSTHHRNSTLTLLLFLYLNRLVPFGNIESQDPTCLGTGWQCCLATGWHFFSVVGLHCCLGTVLVKESRNKGTLVQWQSQKDNMKLIVVFLNSAPAHWLTHWLAHFLWHLSTPYRSPSYCQTTII